MLAEATALRLQLGHEEVEQVRHAAELHDVGKVAVPDAILSKPGPLDAEEWAFIRRHTLIGERIVAAAPALARVALLLRSSHERWDGAGYPDGLAGEAHPARRADRRRRRRVRRDDEPRPYSRAAHARRPRSPSSSRCAGTQFDPGSSSRRAFA